MNKELIEGLKELLRTALMSVIPLAVVGLQEGSLNLKALGVALGVALLSGVDKWLHKSDKGVAGNGLTGF